MTGNGQSAATIRSGVWRGHPSPVIGMLGRYPAGVRREWSYGKASKDLTRVPVTGTIDPVRYEWDKAKAASNLQLHGVDFRDAISALEDPDRIEDDDDRFGYGEERDLVIGMSSGGILFVVATYRDEDTRRIISARKATKHEKDRYYAVDREIW